MREQRELLVNRIRLMGHPVARVCRELGVSRKTAYKWLKRSQARPGEPLVDQSRRPHSQPRQTPQQTQTMVLATRDRYGWGARKLRALLPPDIPAPSIHTVHQILKRNGRVADAKAQRVETPPMRFERALPNELWQLDHKGPLEIGRRKRHPLTILDDHSRYLLRVEPCADLSMNTVWSVLWDVFGDAGLPGAILCDGAFAARNSPSGTLTRFESWLIRLGIDPLHGRPYHPQTQGKVERLHGTFVKEMYQRVRMDSDEHFRADAAQWRALYNCIRPHEAVGDRPPASRWVPSPRKRPAQLPQVTYPTGSVLRRCDAKGTLCYASNSFAVGEGLAGEQLRVVEDDTSLRLYYAWKQVRVIPLETLKTPKRLRQ